MNKSPCGKMTNLLSMKKIFRQITYYEISLLSKIVAFTKFFEKSVRKNSEISSL